MTRSNYELAITRQQLLSLQRQLEADLEHFDHWRLTQLGYGNALVDDASIAFDQATQLTLRNNTERQLHRVRQALERVNSGRFGMCECCREPIHPDRLQVIPDAKFCITCQHLQEHSPLGQLRRMPGVDSNARL